MFATEDSEVSLRSIAEDGMLESPGRKQDLRVARTRSSLWSTLVALIDEMGYFDISVRDITTRAGVNRTTFYRHYEDKDDLFRQGCVELFDSILDRLRSLLEGISIGERRWMPEYFDRMFAVIDAERETFKIVGGPKGNPEFRSIMTDKIDSFIIEERFKPWYAVTGTAEAPHMAELYACSVSSVLIGLTSRWLSGPDAIPLETISEVYRTVITKGVKHYSRSAD